MPRLDEYLLIAQASEYLGVCPNTLRNWGNSGKIKDRKINLSKSKYAIEASHKYRDRNCISY